MNTSVQWPGRSGILGATGGLHGHRGGALEPVSKRGFWGRRRGVRRRRLSGSSAYDKFGQFFSEGRRVAGE